MSHQENPPPQPFLAVVVILSSYYLFIFMLLAIFSQESLEKLSIQNQRYLIILSEISFAIVPIIYLKYQNFSLFKNFRLQKAPPSILMAAIPLGLGMTFLMEALLRILNMIFPPPAETTAEVEAVLSASDPFEFLLIIFGLVVIAPLIEELIFRGFLQRSLEFHIAATTAILYGSIGWAILHITPYYFAQIVPLFLYGFILGYLSYKSGSIWPSVICHAINNGMAVLSVNTGFEKNIPFYYWGDHLSPFVIALAIVTVAGSIRFIERFYVNEAESSNANKLDENR